MRFRLFNIIHFIFPVVVLLAGSLHAHPKHPPRTQSGDVNLKVNQLAQLDGIPWGMDFLNDNTLLITLKSGQLAALDPQTRKLTWIQGVPEVNNAGQGGLMDVAVLKTNTQPEWIYLSYTKPVPDGSVTALGRAHLRNGQLAGWQTLFTANHPSRSSKHFGSRIAFDRLGHVFLSLGERGNRKDAQNLQRHAGKIIRLNLDGSVPADNPFIRQDKASHAIWSYGHRNPQGLYFDSATQTLWSSEHGPRGGDEINRIQPGENYGWPVVSHGKEYWGPVQIGEGSEKPGITAPQKVFTPSIAPGDLIRYQGRLFPGWQGDFISTALAKRHLNRTRIKPGTEPVETRYLQSLKERMRSLTEAPDGALIISTDSGKILRVTPN